MKLTTIFLATISCMLGGCAIWGGAGSDYLVRGEVGFLSLSPDGDLALASGAITSTNSVEDLGLDDKENPPYGKVSARLGSNEFTFSGFQTDFSGTGTATAGFGSITVGTPVSSTLDLTNVKFLYKWYLVDLPVVSFGPSLGVDYIDLKAEAVSSGLGLTEDFSAKAPLPVPGLAGELRLGPLRAFADFNAISANVGDIDGTFIDAEAGLRFSPLPMAEALIGYRLIRFEASGTDNGQNFDVDYKLPGIFFSVGIRF